MDKRCGMDNVRLAAVYRRFNKDPKVDINDPENIIIALEEEIEQYRGKREYAESRINALCAQQMEIIKLEQKLNKEREQQHIPGGEQTEPLQRPTQRFIYAERKSQRVHLIMQPSVIERAKAAAESENISLNEYIHRAITEKLNREGK